MYTVHDVGKVIQMKCRPTIPANMRRWPNIGLLLAHRHIQSELIHETLHNIDNNNKKHSVHFSSKYKIS